MSLYRDKYYTLVKMCINWFMAIFLSWLVLIPTTGESWLRIAGSAFSTLFYLMLLFFSTCEVGLQDCIPIEAGRMKKKWYKGTLYTLVLNVPAILASVVASVAHPFIEAGGDAIKNVYAISNGINELFLHIMYKGMLLDLPDWISKAPWIYLPIILLSLVIGTLGYLAGTKGLFASVFIRKQEK